MDPIDAERRIKDLEEERGYLKSWVNALLPPPSPLTEEESEKLRKSPWTLDQVIAEIEQRHGSVDE